MIGTHGIVGALRIALLTDFPRRLSGHKRLLLGEEHRPVDVLSLRTQGEAALLRIAQATTREQAAAMRGLFLYLPRESAATLDADTYFWHDIVGIRVVTAEGSELGEVREILRTGANDVYVVEGALGEVLLPAIREVISQVDIAGRLMIVTPLPGLLPDSA